MSLTCCVGERWELIKRCRYENAEVALNTGMILREMLRHEPLARTLLYSDKCVTVGPGERSPF